MPYVCQKCGREWDDSLAAENEFYCTRRCGGALARAGEMVSPTGAALPGADGLPYPAALAVERLRAAMVEGRSAWDRITLFKDAVEATVKGFCVYGLGAYLVSPVRNIERDEVLLELLVRPSAGHWVELLGVLCKYLGDEAQPCRSLHRMFFTRRGAKDAATPAYRALQEFVALRNELHHGARKGEADYERDLARLLPPFRDILSGAAFLGDCPLLKPRADGTAELWSGPARSLETEWHGDAGEVGRIGFVAEGGRFIGVEPFIMFLDCGDCATDRLFLYDSQKSYGTTERRKRVYMLEYDGGHRPHLSEPVAPLEERFTIELMRRVYSAFRTKMVAVERYLRDFGSIVEEHGEIVGRGFVRERVESFLEARQSGVLLITGEPGIGKTAIMANLVEAELGRAHFFYRHTSGLRSPDDFVNCVFHSLLNKYGLEAESPSTDPKEMRAQFENLLPKIAGLLRPGEKEVVIVDALDESAPAFDGATAAQLVPARLPDGIYFILSSRPNNPDFRRLASRGDAETFELRADSAENRADAYSYVRSVLGERCDEETGRLIADRAEWNFLFLKLLCESIARDDYSPEEIDDFLDRSPKLYDWYMYYWERLEREFAARPEQLLRINSVIGAIAAAGAPVTKDQVCESLDLAPALFDWSLRFIGQYLDVIPFTEDGAGRRGARELVLYRIYHFSFREFVRARLHPDLKPFHTRWTRMLRGWRELEGHEYDYALRHLPRHLAGAGRGRELGTLLIDLEYIEAKCDAGLTYDLVSDYQTALAADALDAESRATIEEFARFVRAESHVFARRAWLVFQQAANEPDNAATARAARERLEASRETRPWLRWLDKPQARSACLLTLTGHQQRRERVYRCAFSPDGARLLTAGKGYLKTWDTTTGTELHTLEGHDGDISDCAFSPDGARVVSASFDNTLKVWDAGSGRELVAMRGHTRPVRYGAWLPGGERIISGSYDSTIRVWNAESGAELYAWSALSQNPPVLRRRHLRPHARRLAHPLGGGE